MNSSALLIVNPTAGSFSEKSLMKAVDIIKGGYQEIEVVYTGASGEAGDIARKLQNQFGIIIVVGGDGTFNEVANALAMTGQRVSFLPAGTRNVMAYEFSLPPRDITEAAKRIVEGKEHTISLGEVSGRFFVSMAGIGFDAETVSRLKPEIKRVSGTVAHILSGIGVFLRYSPQRLKVMVDGKVTFAYSLIVCNGRYYAGPYSACPSADIMSDTFEILALESASRTALLKTIRDIVTGRINTKRWVRFLTGRKLSIEGTAPIQVDGEFVGYTPSEITIRPGALKVVY